MACCITNCLPKKVSKPFLTIFTSITSGLSSQFATNVVVCEYGIAYETRVTAQLKVDI